MAEINDGKREMVGGDNVEMWIESEENDVPDVDGSRQNKENGADVRGDKTYWLVKFVIFVMIVLTFSVGLIFMGVGLYLRGHVEASMSMFFLSGATTMILIMFRKFVENGTLSKITWILSPAVIMFALFSFMMMEGSGFL